MDRTNLMRQAAEADLIKRLGVKKSGLAPAADATSIRAVEPTDERCGVLWPHMPSSEEK
jgi:hypothetical protein